MSDLPGITVAIKSYQRAGRVSTIKVAPFAMIWVPESQAVAYEAFYPGQVVAIPDERDGNVCRKANAILEMAPTPWVLILDDDISGVGYWEAGGHHSLDPEGLAAMIVQGFVLAADLGCRLWGIAQNKDERNYMTHTPLNLLAPILSPFTGHLADWLRYDEALPLKDDYDFWLQHILHHRKTLRLNKYHYTHGHADNPGGLAGTRSKGAEMANIEGLAAKWGAVVSFGGSAGSKTTGTNILNTRARVPIPGC